MRTDGHSVDVLMHRVTTPLSSFVESSPVASVLTATAAESARNVSPSRTARVAAVRQRLQAIVLRSVGLVPADEGDSGWVYTDDLADMLEVTPTKLNVYVHRIRKSMAEAHVHCADQIVERRTDTHQLRVGTPRLSIERRWGDERARSLVATK
jgi:hypothetical protein